MDQACASIKNVNSDSTIAHDIEAALQASYINSERKIVTGTVQDVDREKSLVFIDVGLKSEGTVSLKEFFLPDEHDSLCIGKKVEVFLEKLDTRDGGVLISRAKAIRDGAWLKLTQAYNEGLSVAGIAFSRVKGGVSVDFDGVIAFLPGSQIDVRPIKDISHIIGKQIEYKILSIDINHSIIVSRKAILESEKSLDREKFLSCVQEGSILPGIVKNITHYGAFVDLGDVDGLLHITDILWKKISHPSEVLHIGQEIQVKVIRYDKECQRLSLGMKHLAENPWTHIADKYPPGKIVKGVITNVARYGAFVQLEPGVEGLLHSSEICWTKDGNRKCMDMQVDDEIEAVIVEVDVERHRVGLSMKRMMENPWEKFAKNHNTGEVLNGTVKNVTDFGIFVGIGDSEVDGLVHVSDLSWSGNTAAEIAKYKKDDPIQVIYLGSDLKCQRIRFGIKQLSDDPFEKYKHLIIKDKVVTCKVISIMPDGIEVELFDSVRSFIKRSHLARERVEQRVDKFVVNDRIDVKIVSFHETTRKLVLSIKAYEEDEHNRTLQEYGAADTGATIGSILGKALQNAGQSEKS